MLDLAFYINNLIIFFYHFNLNFSQPARKERVEFFFRSLFHEKRKNRANSQGVKTKWPKVIIIVLSVEINGSCQPSSDLKGWGKILLITRARKILKKKLLEQENLKKKLPKQKNLGKKIVGQQEKISPGLETCYFINYPERHNRRPSSFLLCPHTSCLCYYLREKAIFS